MTGAGETASSPHGGEVRSPRIGTQIPPGTFLIAFDESLRVTSVESSDGPEFSALTGQPLATVIGAAESAGLERAAREAIAGETSTHRAPVPDASEVVVRVGPRDGGGGVAVVFDLPPDGLGGERCQRELQDVGSLSRALARTTYLDEARGAICDEAHSAAAADATILLEPDAEGLRLLATASSGVDADGAVLPLNEASGAAVSLRTNSVNFVADTRLEAPVAGELLRGHGLESALWQPVARGRTIRAILAVGWRAVDRNLEPRVMRMLELIGVEAAVSLDRGGALERLLGMAHSDILTGLPNRRSWEDELRRELARAARQSSPLTVAMLDLDGFKEFNDTRGHPAGDRVLRRVADLWRPLIRATDTLCRFGGDEFALLLPGCELDQARALMGRLRSASAGQAGFCAGIALWDGNDSGGDLVARADRALYAAKRERRGTVLEAG